MPLGEIPPSDLLFGYRHLFFRALRGFVKKGGIVKVASNAFATGVRFSDIIVGARLDSDLDRFLQSRWV